MVGMGKILAGSNGNWLGRLADTSPGNKNQQHPSCFRQAHLYIFRRSLDDGIHGHSQRSMGKRSASVKNILYTSFPNFCFLVNGFGLWTTQTEYFAWSWGAGVVGNRLGCYSVLFFWKNPPKLKVMSGPLTLNSNLASRRIPVYQKFRRRPFPKYFQLWKLHTHSRFTYPKKFVRCIINIHSLTNLIECI